jgi:hypothetical protein
VIVSIERIVGFLVGPMLAHCRPIFLRFAPQRPGFLIFS